jgi:hypothetical protein
MLTTSSTPAALTTEERSELARLRRELKTVTMGEELPRKAAAAAFFANADPG